MRQPLAQWYTTHNACDIRPDPLPQSPVCDPSGSHSRALCDPFTRITPLHIRSVSGSGSISNNGSLGTRHSRLTAVGRFFLSTTAPPRVHAVRHTIEVHRVWSPRQPGRHNGILPIDCLWGLDVPRSCQIKHALYPSQHTTTPRIDGSRDYWATIPLPLAKWDHVSSL